MSKFKKDEEVIEPEQRFLHKQTDVLCEITDLILGDLPMMSIRLRAVSVSNDTFSGGTKMGGCTREPTFPFDANVDITHFDDCTAEDLISTVVHELTHAFSHRLAFFRNGVESWDKLDEAEECFCRMSGTVASNVFKNYAEIKKYLDEYLNNIPKK